MASAWSVALQVCRSKLHALVVHLRSFNSWKVLAIIFAILNLKSLPLGWHIRLLNGLLKHFLISPARLTPATGPSSLFLPMKIDSRVPLLDCDYNLHKSNSTYFTDFDVARLHLLTCLVSSGMVRTGAELGKGARVSIVLGAASCNFRREIKPYEAFEVWSRILAWDRKWLYTITHFVKKGSVKPKGWTLQPWRKVRPGRRNVGKVGGMTADEVNVLEKIATAESGGNLPNGAISPSATPAHPAIFASAIAKYVFKHKRLTIPPERILRSSNLFPQEPAILTSPPPSESRLSSASNVSDAFPSPSPNPTPTPDTTLLSIPGASKMVLSLSTPGSSSTEAHTDANRNAHASAQSNPSTEAADSSWSWTRIEAERQRGLRIAAHLASLEELNGEFTYDGNLALGAYTDLF